MLLHSLGVAPSSFYFLNFLLLRAGWLDGWLDRLASKQQTEKINNIKGGKKRASRVALGGRLGSFRHISLSLGLLAPSFSFLHLIFLLLPFSFSALSAIFDVTFHFFSFLLSHTLCNNNNNNNPMSKGVAM